MKGIFSFKRLVVLVTIFCLVAVPCATCLAQGFEDDTEILAGKMVGDALVVRPLGFCAMVIGSVMFVVSLPFSASGRNVKPAFDRLMADPALFTFNRPLGQF
ncbi:conserved hypothetical protein [Desulfosarcina cetonica]|uniref:hypothetical protein n=1 Tax=Desulfosarcina cetonica TaxID=90730 RepID=UPI0006CF3C92|nr:hypothetical protein [Desulfosarcina cetonica]VTR70200.1 conserved hypothetical protein [Desulfosarcina cetonica]